MTESDVVHLNPSSRALVPTYRSEYPGLCIIIKLLPYNAQSTSIIPRNTCAIAWENRHTGDICPFNFFRVCSGRCSEVDPKQNSIISRGLKDSKLLFRNSTLLGRSLIVSNRLDRTCDGQAPISYIASMSFVLAQLSWDLVSHSRMGDRMYWQPPIR